MNRALFNRRIRQLHLWLGLAIGAQVGLWLISGLFMTWFPIEHVRGEHLRSEQAVQTIPDTDDLVPLSVVSNDLPFVPIGVEMKMLAGKPVWYLEGEEDKLLIDALTGEKLSPLSEDTARSLAVAAYNSKGDIAKTVFYQEPPREYGREGPVWRVEFGKPKPASFYVDATTGEVRAVRTTLWRVFDFMWGLHIMDWSTRENFNSWWIKMTASLAVLFFLAGLGLAVLRVSSMISRQRK